MPISTYQRWKRLSLTLAAEIREIGRDRHRLFGRHIRPAGIAFRDPADQGQKTADGQAYDLTENFATVPSRETNPQHQPVGSRVQARPWLPEDVGPFGVMKGAIPIPRSHKRARAIQFKTANP